MANKKITALTPLGATPAAADILPVVDDPAGPTPVTKSVTVTNLMAAAPVQTVATRTGNVVLAASDVSGLGNVVSYDAGVAGGEVVLLNASAQLPAVDGSLLTGVVSSSARTWINDSSTAYALSASDAGKIIEFSNSATITVTVASGLGAGFTCDLLQGGAGKVLLSPGAGITLFGGTSGTDIATEGQYCGVTLTLDYLGTTGYLTGQVGAGAAVFSGLTLSNMSGSGYYFDDYMGTISGGGTGSWGSSQYFSGTASMLAGKYKKYTAAANASMRSDINTALGISGSWMSNSYGSGSLYAVANNYVASSTTGPLYVFAGPSGASPTATTDGGTGLKYIPIIYGIDFSGSSGYGPAWGMTFVYNEGGNAEESYDVSGNYNSSYSPACYFWGSSSSTTQSSFSADGSDGNYYPPNASGGMFYGDQA